MSNLKLEFETIEVFNMETFEQDFDLFSSLRIISHKSKDFVLNFQELFAHFIRIRSKEVLEAHPVDKSLLLLFLSFFSEKVHEYTKKLAHLKNTFRWLLDSLDFNKLGDRYLIEYFV